MPATVPLGCVPETNKTNIPQPAPRLSISSPRTTVIVSMETPSQGLQTVMKWKTVVAIFFVVVGYLVTGGLVFRALEQPEESSQKTRIANDKAEFLQENNCVSQQELEALIKVRTSEWVSHIGKFAFNKSKCSIIKKLLPLLHVFLPLLLLEGAQKYLLLIVREVVMSPINFVYPFESEDSF